MKIYSFIQQGFELQSVEIEVSFMSGIPNIHFMGQADISIKEGVLRIKSALKRQGYDLPRGRQVLVNLKPPYIKKHSQGLDLAIACAILWASGQVSPPKEDKVYVYGELNLEGEVNAPLDIDYVSENLDGPLLSGEVKTLNCPMYKLNKLKDLEGLVLTINPKISLDLKRPKREKINFSIKAAEALMLIALGEHSALIAGPSGSGKTTFAKHLHTLLIDPKDDVFKQSKKMNQLIGYDVHWRPFVDPHHTITPLAMVGGGFPIFPGEISRAHGGVLYLDELLEFHSKVKESLREPIETGKMTIRRKNERVQVPSKFLLLATTNLCPCGDLSPNKHQSCRFSLGRCRSYLEKLSGPLLDRFNVLILSDEWIGDKKISLEEINEDIEKARVFQRNRRHQLVLNAELTIDEIDLEPFIRENLLPEMSGSIRRQKSFLQVARSFADLEACLNIEPKHIDKAFRFTIKPFMDLKKIFS